MILKTLSKPAGPEWPDHTLFATVRTERDYFSVTGEISTAHQRGKQDASCCGCIHEEILQSFPQLAPLVALHLSDLNGIPMHAEANGWYWLAGATDGRGERYHGGNDKRTKEECLAILADHLRIPLEDARSLAFKAVANNWQRADFDAYCDDQKPRWKAEAEAGLALANAL